MASSRTCNRGEVFQWVIVGWEAAWFSFGLYAIEAKVFQEVVACMFRLPRSCMGAWIHVTEAKAFRVVLGWMKVVLLLGSRLLTGSFGFAVGLRALVGFWLSLLDVRVLTWFRDTCCWVYECLLGFGILLVGFANVDLVWGASAVGSAVLKFAVLGRRMPGVWWDFRL